MMDAGREQMCEVELSPLVNTRHSGIPFVFKRREQFRGSNKMCVQAQLMDGSVEADGDETIFQHVLSLLYGLYCLA